jgi:DNA-binding transcriptional regulator GbsR (MarR family)
MSDSVTADLDEDFIRAFQTGIGGAGKQDALASWIYARLYIEPGEMTLAALAEEAGYSLASVSNKVRALEQAGCVVRRTRPGTRKVYVSAHKDITGVFMRQLEQIRRTQTLVMMREIPPMIERYAKGDMPREMAEKIALLRGMYEDMTTIDGIITEMTDRIAAAGGGRSER